jgi:predicted phage terminase large subunit-like protein
VLDRGGVMNFVSDTAYDEKSKILNNDPSGIMAYCFYNNTLYVYNYVNVYMELPTFIEFMQTFVANNRYTAKSMIRIEPKASGKSIIQTLRSYTKLNVTAAPSPKEGKTERLMAKTAFIESGRVVLVDGGWNKEFVESIILFPNASHDEEVDCLIMGIDCSTQKKPSGIRPT